MYPVVDLHNKRTGLHRKKFYCPHLPHRDGHFDVVEKYDVDFTEYKHGLIRNIVTRYNFQTEKHQQEERNILISNIYVPGHPFSVTPDFKRKWKDEVEIKIGDKDVTVTGPQHYEIRYRVKNAFIYTDSLVEFYWNVKPSQWQATFEKVELTINAPEHTLLSPKNSFIYSGATGTAHPSNDFTCQYENGILRAQSKKNIRFSYDENVTVLVKLPAGAIAQKDFSPTFLQEYGWVGILLIPLLLFWRVWAKYGKDDRAIAITSYYPPENIDASLAGYLFNDKANASDLIALIPKWGADGIIRLEEIPKKGWFGSSDTKIHKIKELPPAAANYEKTIFHGLFRAAGKPPSGGRHKAFAEEKMRTGEHEEFVLVSSLKDTFYSTMAEAKKDLKKSAREFYVAKSNLVMNISIGVSILLAAGLSFLLLYSFGVLAACCGFLVGVFLALMSFYLRKKNSRGTRVYAELKGFRQFIKYAELERLKMLNEQDPRYLEKTMSYALAFGLLKEWAAKFDDLNIPPPDWYTNGSNMGMNRFASSFSGSMTTARTAMVSSPSRSSSSGGGSSGGGFGRGGGGSW